MAAYKKTIEVTVAETGEIFRLSTPELVGNVRDVLLSKRKLDLEGVGWSRLSEAAQQREIDHADQLAYDLVVAIADIVAAGGVDVIHATLDNYKVKDGTLTLTAKGIADDGAVVQLNHVGKKPLKIIVLDPEQFDEHRETVKPDPDQPNLMDDDDLQEEPTTAQAAADAIANDPDATQVEKDAVGDQHKFGYESRKAGRSADENPFSPEQESYEHWRIGWEKADAEIAAEILADGVSANDAETVAAADAEAPEAEPVGNAVDPDDIIEEGYKAREDGMAPGRCPYDKGTDAFDLWMKGYKRRKKEEGEA